MIVMSIVAAAVFYCLVILSASMVVPWRTTEVTASKAAFADGTLFIGSDDDALHALDADTGKVRWTFHTRHQVFSSPSVAGGRVYFGEGLHHTNDACLYCVDAKTGTVWLLMTHNLGTDTEAAIVSGKAKGGRTVWVTSSTRRRSWSRASR